MLNGTDSAAIEARLRAVEQRTGARVVVAVVARTGRFHELCWRAFALGAALGALCVVLADGLHPQWVTSQTALVTAVLILGAGLALAALAAAWPAFARLFMTFTRAEAAVHARALALFVERGCGATPGRNAVLMLAGRYERAIAIVADAAYRDRVDTAGWQQVVDAATASMARGDARAAFIAALDALEALLVARGFAPMPGQALAPADAPIDLGDDR